MEAIIEKLEKAVAKNEQTCKRILAGRIEEHEAVYIPELPGEKCLNDREIYIWHKAFNTGVKAALDMLKSASAPEQDLLAEVFQEK